MTKKARLHLLRECNESKDKFATFVEKMSEGRKKVVK